MRFLLLFNLSLFCLYFKGQNNINCVNMAPICTSTGLTFQANTGIPNASISDTGNNYGCLQTNPNPSWYYLQISQSGNLLMTLSAAQDIDFVMWGPFSNLTNAIANCNSYSAADIVPNLPNGCGGFGSTCTQQGCSYSASNIETPSIDNAIAGEVYVLLVTNYANVVQNISLVQSGGTGGTNCNILNPCSMTYINASISSCDNLTGTYGISGVVEFSNPPNFGTLVVKNCSGDSVIFNPPFTSPLNYNINNILYSGNQNCSITSYFTDDNVCSLSTNSFIEPSCPDSCLVTILTVNASICNGDSLFIGGAYQTSAGNYVDSLYSAFGCDSIISTVLTINNSSSGIDVQIACDSLTWIDGVTYTTSNNSATHILTNTAGCDSVVTLNLTINNSEINIEVVNVCDSFNWNGTTYTTSGQFVDTLQTSSGCDSIVTLNLEVSNNVNYVDTIFVCDSLEINGVNYTSSFDYTDTLQTIDGCDSIVSLNINVNYSELVNNIDTICSYELPYEWNGFVFDTAGLQILTLNTLNGCDSNINYSLYTIECDDQIFSINIPNIFTPNGDGENDVFEITGTHFDIVEFYIYNRWNSLLFFTDRNIGWKGRNMAGGLVSDGTYFYIIKIKKYEDHNKSNFTFESYKGSLMLLTNN